ncbi:site-specific DNA-methyltransferase [Bacillus rhizoplanae]|uniref:site-specific DNA-methyltransferase n=1 Tax=Bacillus rhizoplanae TaxID=2880966 RepID=UPI003D1E943C
MSIEELKRPTRIDEERIQKLKELFPEAFVDGKLNIGILQDEIVGVDAELIEEDSSEAYGLQWSGKKEARKMAFLPPTGTLKPKAGSGINEDVTGNLIIEGDNLEVLRLLQKSYAGRIKTIYIDPPYNTGNDFVYKDDFKEPVEKYLLKSGQADEKGLLTSNPKSGGRYHGNWLNMMYPRLKLARNLLREDGSIFVSIDDNEQANLKKLMDEIFGEENFVTTIVWQKKFSPQNDATYFSDMHDYILVYAKVKKQSKGDSKGWTRNLIPRKDEENSRYKNPDNDPRGPWTSGDLSVKTYSKDYDYPVTTPSGRIVNPPQGSCWRVPKSKLEELIQDNRIWFGIQGGNVPRLKRFLSEVQDGIVPVTWWKREDNGDNQEATRELRQLFTDTGVPFETPKPVRLIKKILQLSTKPNSDDIVLDFFAGSGTTAQAVLEQNREDGGNRKFILVQIPDKVEHKYFSSISEVTIERVKRVINHLNEEDSGSTQQGRDFVVYELQKSNFKKWNGSNIASIAELEANLDIFANTHFLEMEPGDIICEIMLIEGFPLNSSVGRVGSIEDVDIWEVTSEDIPFKMLVCLEEKLTSSAVNYLVQNHNRDLLICLDDALSNEAKVVLSEMMKVKTI